MPADERARGSAHLTDGEWISLLEEGSVVVKGRLPWSSNFTFLVALERKGVAGRAVYKPGRGERGLWDFPGGLYRREVAAFELDRVLALGAVPATVLRSDLPLGEGSLQRFIDADFSEHYFSLRDSQEHGQALREIAAFDLLANNADRKGGHLLIDESRRLWAIDNGLSFHVEPKLRTVMWDFIGEAIPAKVLAGARRLVDEVPEALARLLDLAEVEALSARAREMVAHPVFPEPDEEARLPWPLV